MSTTPTRGTTPQSGTTPVPGSTSVPRPMTRHNAPSVAQSVWLVATREILVRLRSKAFLISTGILLLISVASVVAGGIVSQNTSLDSVAVVGSAGAVVEATGAFEIVEVDDVAAAEALVRDGSVDAAVVPNDSGAALLPVTVIGLDAPPSGVIGALSVSPDVQVLQPAEQGGGLAYLVAFAFGIVFLMSASTFGGTISQSVVEEKQTRIVEILMSTISVRALLAGKVLGNSIMAFGQIVAIGLLAAGGMAVTGQRVLLADVGPAIGWFVVFFAFGFVLLASLYAATASMVSRQEDVGTVTSPVLILTMIPYFLVVFFNDNAFVVAIMSYVPFSAPVGMPLRIFLGTAEWWEPLASLLILIASTAVVILLGSRIYSNSLLRMGARVSLRDALKR